MNKRWISLLLMLAMILVGAVGLADYTFINRNTPCTGNNGTHGAWVKSDYAYDGGTPEFYACGYCGAVCTGAFYNGSSYHDPYEMGADLTCEICPYVYTCASAGYHSFNPGDPDCSYCDYVCPHDFDGSEFSCGICGFACQYHAYTEDKTACAICKMPHEHSFSLGSSNCVGGCGYICEHTSGAAGDECPECENTLVRIKFDYDGGSGPVSSVLVSNSYDDNTWSPKTEYTLPTADEVSKTAS